MPVPVPVAAPSPLPKPPKPELTPGAVAETDVAVTAPLLPGTGQAHRLHQTGLERELAGYWTNAQRNDLEATLDQYPDDVTREVREILAGQAAAADDNQVRTVGRYWCRGF